MAWMGLCKKDDCQNCMWRHFRFESMPVTIARWEIRDFLFDCAFHPNIAVPNVLCTISEAGVVMEFRGSLAQKEFGFKMVLWNTARSPFHVGHPLNIPRPKCLQACLCWKKGARNGHPTRRSWRRCFAFQMQLPNWTCCGMWTLRRLPMVHAWHWSWFLCWSCVKMHCPAISHLHGMSQEKMRCEKW